MVQKKKILQCDNCKYKFAPASPFPVHHLRPAQLMTS